MTNHSELKRLAEVLRDDRSDFQVSQASWEYYQALQDPETVLALIAEIEQLKAVNFDYQLGNKEMKEEILTLHAKISSMSQQMSEEQHNLDMEMALHRRRRGEEP